MSADDLHVVALIGGSVRDHPYIQLLHRTLEQRGVRVDVHSQLSRSWIRDLPESVDAVHLHWPDFLGYRVDRPVVGGVATHLLGLRVLADLRALRKAPPRFVWTVHDLLPYEIKHRRLEEAIYRSASAGDGVLVHSHYAAERLKQFSHRPNRLAVAPLGNFIDYYPADQRGRDEIQATLGLPGNAYVYLLFGMIRPYKRTAEAVRAFRSLDATDVRLVVAGKPSDPVSARAVEQAAEGDERIRLDLGFVPDEQVSSFHEAADAVILNHREVFSSGALVVALSYGLPVVAPAGGTTEEVVAPPALESFEPGELPSALERVRHGDQAERGSAALDAAARCSWEYMADRLVALYSGSDDPRAA